MTRRTVDLSVLSQMDHDFESFHRRFGPNRRESLIPGGGRILERLESGGSSDDSSPASCSPPKKMPRVSLAYSGRNRNEDIIQARTKISILEAQIRSMQRSQAEERAQSERNKLIWEQNKKKLEQRVESLSKEVAFVKEQSLKTERMVEDRRKSGNEELLAALSKPRPDSHLCIEQLAELEYSSNKTLEALNKELMEERRRCAAFVLDLEEGREAAENTNTRNQHLGQELIHKETELLTVRAEAKELAETFRQWKEESKVALEARAKWLEATQLGPELQSLRRKCQIYKSLSENTSLLKEKNEEVERKLEQIRNQNEDLLNENAELKLRFVEASPEPCLGRVDALSAEVTTLRRARDSLLLHVKNLESELIQKDAAIETIRQELSSKFESFELQENSFRERLALLEERCIGLEEELGQSQAENKRLEEAQQQMAEVQALATPQPEGIAGEAEFILQRQVEEKDALIDALKERLHMKGDFDPADTKVLHMECNPLSEAQKEYREEVETLRSENERLVARVEALESGRDELDGDVTGRVDIRLAENRLHQQIQELEEEKARMQREKQKMNQLQTAIGRQYREMVTLLTGYQCKMKEEGVYQVHSTFESLPDHHFLFRRSEDTGTVCLLENDYSFHWRDFVDTYLEQDDCIPGFLAAVTLQLFHRDREQASTGPDVSSV